MWAFRGTLPNKYLMVLFSFFDIVTRVTTDRVYAADCEQLELDVAEFLSLLELTFPATELTIVFHLLQHVVLFMQLWGPVPRYWMFSVERMLGFLVRKVKNRAHPEANITASYQLFRAALLHRRDIERSLAQSPHFARYAKHLDSSHKLSSTSPAASAFSGEVRALGSSSRVQLTDNEHAGLVAMLRLFLPEYDRLLRDWEADVGVELKGGKRRGRPAGESKAAAAASAAPQPGAWLPAGRVVSDAERDLLLGPKRSVLSFPRALCGGVTFRAANKQAASTSTRWVGSCLLLLFA